MNEFDDRVAVVTGGASGIGRAMARAFSRRGAHLVLADIDEEALACAKQELIASGRRVLAVPTDVRERESVSALAKATYREFGRAHVLCNNAGVSPVGSAAGADPADWEVAMGINFWGVVHGIDAFLPRMLEQGEAGHIVNTASMAGLTGMAGLGMYCATKFAVVGLTESLHRELRGGSVGISLLCPMIVETNLVANSQRLLGAAAPPSIATAETAQQHPRGGIVSVEAVANRVLRAIERKDLYIFTHLEQREILRRRAAKQDAMFEAEAWSS